MSALGVLVLAAGRSMRLGGPNKLLMPWRGKALLHHVLALAQGIESHCKVVVVNRDVAQVRALLPQPDAWICVENEGAGSGLASSLRLGLAELGDCHAVVVFLGDMPDIAAATVQALLEATTPDDYALVPVFEGQWGNPVVLARAAMDDCAQLTGDQGARALLMANRYRVRSVEVMDPAILRDFDVLTDFSGPD